MVAAGLGVTLIPEMAAAVESRSAPVVVQRLASPPSRTVGLVWRQSDPLADRYVGLADALRSFRA
jgi:LysR family hydrogen peroxide-inducible transcriptional activator